MYEFYEYNSYKTNDIMMLYKQEIFRLMTA